MLGGWITSTNTQRANAAQKAGREANAKRYLTPELMRLIDKVLHIHQRALANYSSAAGDHPLPSDIQMDFVPFMPVLYPSAPQFHDLAGDDAVALVEFYDSLHHLNTLVKQWYDRPEQAKVNIFNVILHTVDQSLQKAKVCVVRFDIDMGYPAKHESVGTVSQRIERALSQSQRLREIHIKRFNEKQQEEDRQKAILTNAVRERRLPASPRPPR